MEINKGFKETDFGLIPEDWEVKELEAVCLKIQDGTHFSPKTGGLDYYYVTSKNIGFGRLKLENLEMIDKLQHQSIYKRCDVKKGDVLLTKDGASTGNAAINKFESEISLLSSVAFLRTKPDKASGEYLLQQLLSNNGQNRIKEAMAGNAITRLTLGKIKKFILPFPENIKEQEAISNALSDADVYIESLEKLIVKKRLIKNGVMSELLTGNRRLPNFSKPWTKMKLGGIGVFSKGSGIKKDESQSGSIPCIRYGEIYTTHDDIIREFKSFISSKVSEQSTKIRTGDILFAGSGETKEEIGKCVAYTLTQEAFAGGDIIILRPTKGISSFFGYYLNSKSIVRQKASRGQGDAVVHISSASLGEIDIFVPEEAEQLAIAEIIMDIDLSVLTLEVKLRKAKLIKQGMMAELLTGRIRLV